MVTGCPGVDHTGPNGASQPKRLTTRGHERTTTKPSRPIGFRPVFSCFHITPTTVCTWDVTDSAREKVGAFDWLSEAALWTSWCDTQTAPARGGRFEGERTGRDPFRFETGLYRSHRSGLYYLPLGKRLGSR